MNGFLTEPVKQKRGLLQEDSISPILFNFAIEIFIQSIIISNSDISGYTLQSTKPAQQWSIQLAVKVLAYADDILILVKYQPNVSNVLYGGKMERYFRVRLRSYRICNKKRSDMITKALITTSTWDIPSTLQFNNVGNSFISDLIAKIKAQVDFFVIWKLSMYDERAKVANTIVLSKNFWRVLRLTSLPKAVIQKLNSIL
ncbi:hypothetical protein PS15m_012103 [Mucor circinelloides]